MYRFRQQARDFLNQLIGNWLMANENLDKTNLDDTRLSNSILLVCRPLSRQPLNSFRCHQSKHDKFPRNEQLTDLLRVFETKLACRRCRDSPQVSEPFRWKTTKKRLRVSDTEHNFIRSFFLSRSLRNFTVHCLSSKKLPLRNWFLFTLSNHFAFSIGSLIAH